MKNSTKDNIDNNIYNIKSIYDKNSYKNDSKKENKKFNFFKENLSYGNFFVLFLENESSDFKNFLEMNLAQDDEDKLGRYNRSNLSENLKIFSPLDNKGYESNYSSGIKNKISLKKESYKMIDNDAKNTKDIRDNIIDNKNIQDKQNAIDNKNIQDKQNAIDNKNIQDKQNIIDNKNIQDKQNVIFHNHKKNKSNFVNIKDNLIDPNEKKIRILILDDEEMNVMILETFLENYLKKSKIDKKKVEVFTFSIFKEAIEKVCMLFDSNIKLDLILTDFYLDNQNTGLKFCIKISELYKSLNISNPMFILVSGEKLNKLESEIFLDMIQKPFKYSDIEKVFEKHKILKN